MTPESPYVIARGCLLALVLAAIFGLPFVVWTVIELINKPKADKRKGG